MDVTFFLSRVFFLSLPFQFALSPISGVDLHISRLFSVAIIFAWLTESFLRRKLDIALRPAAILLLVFLGISSASVLWADDAIASIRRLAFLLSYAPLVFVLSAIVRERGWESGVVLLRSFVVGAFLSAAVAIIIFLAQFIFGVAETFSFLIGTIYPVFLGESFARAVSEYPSLLVNIGGETILRASGLFPDPHIAGFFFGMSIPIAIGLSFVPKENVLKPSFFLMSVVLFLADVLTFSRGAYLGLFSLLLIGSLTFFFNATAWRRRVFSSVLLLLALAFLGFDTPVRSRFLDSFSLEEGSNQGRLIMWGEALSRIQAQPFGYGLANYPMIVKPTASDREPIYAHNLFLDIATESGVPGALAFVLLLLASFAGFFRHRSSLSLACAGALTVFLFHSLVETPLYSVHVFPVLLLILAFACLEKDDSPGVFFRKYVFLRR